MARTSSMGTKTMLARLLFQERITGNDDEIAQTHETNRQSAVKEILVHVFLMSKFKFFPGMLTVEKAENQYLIASGNDEADHCAPGQIMSGSQAIQKLLGTSDDLQLILENLFAKTDEIDLKFNMADSRAEENGLRDAFGSACNHVARVGKFARFNRAFEFYQHIDTAYSLYKTQGLQAITNAINIQRAKLQAGEPLKGTTRQELISILQNYQSKLASSSNSLETVQGLFPEDLWRDYRAIAP